MGAISYRRRRFPPDVIRYAVWRYFRFTLSIRDARCCSLTRDVALLDCALDAKLRGCDLVKS